MRRCALLLSTVLVAVALGCRDGNDRSLFGPQSSGPQSGPAFSTSGSTGGESSPGATVWTDKEDYQPGDTVIISGSGWWPGETVSLLIEEEPEADGPHLFSAEADEDGSFENRDLLIHELHLEVAFTLTATGQTSGLTAQTTFTDHGPSPVTSTNFSITADVNDLVTVSVTLGGGSTTVTLTAAEANIDGLTGDLSLTGPGGDGNGTWTGSFQGDCETTYNINNIKVTWRTDHDHQATETPGPPKPEVTTGACPVADNLPPVVSNIMADPNPVAITGMTVITATISDEDTGGSDVTVAEFKISKTEGLPFNSGWLPFGVFTPDVTVYVSKTVDLSALNLPEAGIYDLCVEGEDEHGNRSESDASDGTDCIPLVVYDPSAGFVTGGGWIDSYAGAYKWDESLEGKASFGFVSQYKKGRNTPDGNTQFQFNAAGFSFHSNDYDWLIVNQAGTNAQFKGKGTIKGQAGEYWFMLWAGDYSPDTFRIRIWEEGNGGEYVIYDNGFNQPISQGSIVIHTGGNGKNK